VSNARIAEVKTTIFTLMFYPTIKRMINQDELTETDFVPTSKDTAAIIHEYWMVGEIPGQFKGGFNPQSLQLGHVAAGSSLSSSKSEGARAARNKYLYHI
jgi:hypothetical protein